jgi:hypothetical protein
MKPKPFSELNYICGYKVLIVSLLYKSKLKVILRTPEIMPVIKLNNGEGI